ncbi:hypothetical protein [Herbaspirillum sp. B65]|uniref:hypothetical protein n=1 Tax=Herbaspirillum sp. B65 TaxID=137708 RepID=UPI000344941A|nr:hypothetical protein [Herbaspirillum sp. B65]
MANISEGKFNFLAHRGGNEAHHILEEQRFDAKANAPAGAIVIYGPQGCGKTRRAKELLAYLKKDRIIDDWRPGQRIPSNAIALTNFRVKGAISYAEIKAKLTARGQA